MRDREWFINQCIGAFPDGAWYYQLDYHPDKQVEEERAKEHISFFSACVLRYLNDQWKRRRPRVMTRTKKWSRDGKIHYTHFMICSRIHERSRFAISDSWEEWMDGTASSELLHTRGDVERRAISIAHYYLKGGTKDE